MLNYITYLKVFRDELGRLIDERNRIDAQINAVSVAIQSIETLAESTDQPIINPAPPHPDDETGFTDRVRAVLESNPLRPLTAVDIRDVLMKNSPYDDAKIVLIHAHNTLKRLERQEEVEEVPGVDGRNAYRWIDKTLSGAVAGLMSAQREITAADLKRRGKEILEGKK